MGLSSFALTSATIALLVLALLALLIALPVLVLTVAALLVLALLILILLILALALLSVVAHGSHLSMLVRTPRSGDTTLRRAWLSTGRLTVALWFTRSERISRAPNNRVDRANKAKRIATESTHCK
ncbi:MULTISPECIES: hypothetical protein [Lysobacter]|uniref:hypothetical protein n=1 Tax=Lysobacter TaxID=68 RepID=UPI001F2A1315|nr:MULTISPECIES: hypothetical protein [Lysobacter]UJB19588.1 hypothetical protein L1A79_00360 [Lysobacter capsici]UJQ26686.1 hypothetical protein L2D09_14500 [Lysobacter gummosus]